MLAYIFSKKANELVFSQAIADMREEHAEALQRQAFWHARWIIVRDHMNLLFSAIAYVAAYVVKHFTDIWKMIG